MRRLLLCLDGVPHTLIERAKSRGLFDSFGPPARLLSPFPTMTNVALSAMLGASPPAGYESLYFDRNARELRGGIRKYIGRRTPDKVPSSYMDELDYQEPLPFEFLIYVAPEKVWRADMQRFRERFKAAPQTRDYFAFLKATDGLLHDPRRAALAAVFALTVGVMLLALPASHSVWVNWVGTSVAVMGALALIVVGEHAWDRMLDSARAAGVVAAH